MKHFKIKLTKDVTIVDDITYVVIMSYKAGQELHAYDENSEAFFVGPGWGIWKTEAVKSMQDCTGW